MYRVVPIQDADIDSVLHDCYDAEKTIHEVNCPQYDFYEDNKKHMMASEDSYAFMDDDKTLVLFGIHVQENPLMWAMPRKSLTDRDKLAYLRRGRKCVRLWHNEFGTLYVPLHKEWEESRKLVYFLGFKKYNDRIAYFDGDNNE